MLNKIQWLAQSFRNQNTRFEYIGSSQFNEKQPQARPNIHIRDLLEWWKQEKILEIFEYHGEVCKPLIGRKSEMTVNDILGNATKLNVQMCVVYVV